MNINKDWYIQKKNISSLFSDLDNLPLQSKATSLSSIVNELQEKTSFPIMEYILDLVK